jgi:4-amino-4-deoxy-L-arabinose transferase-like glycosyltransferase
MNQKAKKFFSSDAFIFWAILFVCFLVRWLYVITLNISVPIRGDAYAYVQYAANIIEHGVFSKNDNPMPRPDSYWAPGYPGFLVFCHVLGAIIGISFYPLALFFQAVLSAITSALVFSTARLTMPRTGAVIVAALTILSPHLMTHSGYILSETLFTFLLMAAVFCYLKALKKQYSLWLVGVSGVLFGLAYLTNPIVLFVPVIFSLLYIIFSFSEKNAMRLRKFISVFLGLFFIFVLSWSVRDKVSVAKTQLSSSDRAFENLIIGSHSNFHDVWRANPRDPLNPYEVDYKKYKNDRVGFYSELASRIADDPKHYLHWYLIKKPLELWGWDILVGYGDVYVYNVNSSLYQKSSVALASLVVMKQLHFWLFLSAILGLYFALKEKNPLQKEIILNIYLCILCISGIYVVLHSDARYSVPLRPEMYLCSMYTIYKLTDWIKQRKAVGTLAN